LGKVVFYNSTERFQNPARIFGGWKFIRGRSAQTWNLEAPWITGGLDNSVGATTRKFVTAGKHYYEGRRRERFFVNGGVYKTWEFEPGTTFGETIDVDGVGTVEVRTLTLNERGKDPTFKVFRRYGKRDEIKDFISSEKVGREVFNDSHNIVNLIGLRDEITLTDTGNREIMKRPLKDVTDVVFNQKGDMICFNPTTKAKKSVIPDNMVGIFGTQACIMCHRTAGKEGRLIDPDPTPDKYGAIRGSNFVFSFNPFD
jgi:hypothetical protein